MKKIPLYRYLREDGGVTVSPSKPEGTTYSRRYRLIAEEGKAITDGKVIVEVIDVKSWKEWTDCGKPEEETSPADMPGLSYTDQPTLEGETETPVQPASTLSVLAPLA